MDLRAILYGTVILLIVVALITLPNLATDCYMMFKYLQAYGYTWHNFWAAVRRFILP